MLLELLIIAALAIALAFKLAPGLTLAALTLLFLAVLTLAALTPKG